jgi:hypothetical protein
MRALQPYVDFGQEGGARSAPEEASRVNGGLRKVLTVLQVERILGPAGKVSDKTEGSVDMNVREYNTEDEHVSCQFVGGVLVNYRVTRGR